MFSLRQSILVGGSDAVEACRDTAGASSDEGRRQDMRVI